MESAKAYGSLPLRDVYLKIPDSRCCNSIAEGFGSRHRDMPQIEFSSEQVDAILNYLGDLIV